jgi:uncharacterized Fe-S cluster protein YjdI
MNTITGYIRLANEENTIIPCLESIKNIFDQILIVYSEITDNSLLLIKDYAKLNPSQNIRIEQYVYNVLPPHSLEYKHKTFEYKHSLAAYYNFGLQFIDTDLLMKIDGDQIYFTKKLKLLIDKVKNSESTEINIGLKGFNCIVSNNCIKLHSSQNFNGGQDHFIVPTNKASFIQTEYWEKLSLKNSSKTCSIQPEIYWVHFKKGHRHNGVFVSGDKYDVKVLQNLDESLMTKYEKYILPLLIKSNSNYQHLIYK